MLLGGRQGKQASVLKRKWGERVEHAPKDALDGVDGKTTEPTCAVERFVRWRILGPFSAPAWHELGLAEVHEQRKRTPDEEQAVGIEDEPVPGLISNLFRQRGDLGEVGRLIRENVSDESAAERVGDDVLQRTRTG